MSGSRIPRSAVQRPAWVESRPPTRGSCRVVVVVVSVPGNAFYGKSRSAVWHRPGEQAVCAKVTSGSGEVRRALSERWPHLAPKHPPNERREPLLERREYLTEGSGGRDRPEARRNPQLAACYFHQALRLQEPQGRLGSFGVRAGQLSAVLGDARRHELAKHVRLANPTFATHRRFWNFLAPRRG